MGPGRTLRDRSGKPPRLPLETEVSWFVLTGILDIVATFLALRYSGEGRLRVNIVESNPVASWVLHHWGVAGMAVFKLFMMGIVVSIAIGIERHRPRLARALLWGGVTVVAAVVIYSARLILMHQ